MKSRLFTAEHAQSAEETNVSFTSSFLSVLCDLGGEFAYYLTPGL